MSFFRRSSNDLGLSRREMLKLTAAGVGVSMAPWFRSLASAGAIDPKRHRSCILLWMSGGPSQTDTFDLKPGHENGGPFKEIETSVPGIRISEHLPQLAKQMDEMAIIRSMSTKEGDHSRGTHLMRTGYLPQGPVQYPTMGSVISKELGQPDAELPNFVSVSPYRFLAPGAFGPGFLGPEYAPLVVGSSNGGVAPQPGGQDYSDALKVQNMSPPDGVTDSQFDARLDLLSNLENNFQSTRQAIGPESHQSTYRQAVKMMRSEARKAFNLEEESAELRERYGQSQFGQGCLLARRLVERGVPFVEVSLSGVAGNQALGWDTHVNNFDSVKRLSEVLDPGWATLMSDLKERGLLDSTLIVWMGEFGRTPKINANKGRDHFPAAWTTVLAGGGIQGGQVVGRTSDSGMTVEERPVVVSDLLATICLALGLDPLKQNMSNVGRPIRLADPEANPIFEVLG